MKSRSPARNTNLPPDQLEDCEYPIQLSIHDDRNEEHKISEIPGMGAEGYVIDELEESKDE